MLMVSLLLPPSCLDSLPECVSGQQVLERLVHILDLESNRQGVRNWYGTFPLNPVVDVILVFS